MCRWGATSSSKWRMCTARFAIRRDFCWATWTTSTRPKMLCPTTSYPSSIATCCTGCPRCLPISPTPSRPFSSSASSRRCRISAPSICRTSTWISPRIGCTSARRILCGGGVVRRCWRSRSKTWLVPLPRCSATWPKTSGKICPTPPPTSRSSRRAGCSLMSSGSSRS